ncbi:MAG: radical SAM family heme chaperone HemW [Verrucomicrobiales bacterium]
MTARTLSAAPPVGGTVRHLYVHIPFCHRICPYCSFYKHTPGATEMQAFVTGLLAELDHHRRELDIRPQTIYFGGGTPSMLSPKHTAALLDGLRGRLDLGELAEWTLEANPRTFDVDKARQWTEAGVTRVSLGVQSWNPKHLETLGRDHSPEEAEEAFHILREAGMPVVNIDHMFALPGQTPDEWKADLQNTILLEPDHISTYNLTYEEDTEFMKRFERGEYHQDPDADAVFFELARDHLRAAGFEHYETSNFARAGDAKDRRSVHNRAYWAGADYLGLGPGAVSTVGGQRWTSLADTARYIECVERFGTAATGIEPLGPEEWRLERIALGLRTSEGIPMALLAEDRRENLSTLETEGLLVLDNERIILTDRGRLLVDSVATALV